MNDPLICIVSNMFRVRYEVDPSRHYTLRYEYTN